MDLAGGLISLEERWTAVAPVSTARSTKVMMPSEGLIGCGRGGRVLGRPLVVRDSRSWRRAKHLACLFTFAAAHFCLSRIELLLAITLHANVDDILVVSICKRLVQTSQFAVLAVDAEKSPVLLNPGSGRKPGRTRSRPGQDPRMFHEKV